MKKPESNKQKEVTAATFKRLAKAQRVRARNHLGCGRAFAKSGALNLYREEIIKSDIYAGLASDLDHEAATLRSMR